MNGQLSKLLLATTMLVVPAAVHAQEVANAGRTLDEVIVTAQKRSERLIDVPLSITAATGEQLAKAGVTAPSDLVKVVPGFTYQPTSFGLPVFSIRGVGFFDNTGSSSPTVTVYVDQVPLPYLSMTAGAALDVERVEVLKGPQGTLFGQNATGGAMNFIAAKPTNELSAGANVEVDNFGKVMAGGFVSGPMSETLGVRLAVRTEQGGAWQKSVTRPGDELGDSDFSSARLILAWTPRDTAKIEFNVNGWTDKSDTLASQYIRYVPTNPVGYVADVAPILLATPAAPRDNRHADWDPDHDMSRDTKFYQLSLRGEFDLSEAVKLSTISAYSNLDMVSPGDPDGTQLKNLYYVKYDNFKTYYQELRLSGQALGEKLKWMFGGNYGHDTTDEVHVSDYIATNSGVGPNRYSRFATVNNGKSETIGVFGSLDYQLTDTFSLQGSVRYTDSKLDGGGCLQDVGDGKLAAALSLLSTTPSPAGSCVTLDAPVVTAGVVRFSPVGGLVKKRLNEDNLAWRGNLSWKPNSDVHLYVNVTKGYKAGSFSTLPLVFSAQYQPVPQESVLAYEAGFKISALDRTLQASGAAFYYDYKDKQILGYVLTPFGNLPGLVTVPKSRIAGGELNLNWRPVEALVLNGGVTYVDSKVQRSFVTRDPFGVNIDIKGYSFPITPKWQASADAEYSFPLSDTFKAFVGAALTYRSDTPVTFGGGPEFVSPAYTLVDLRAGIESPDGKWRAQVWGRNVFDKFYTINITHFIDTVARTTGRPATYGVSLSAQF